MARAIVNTTLNFGLVTIPIRICTAIRDSRESLRKLHQTCLTPIQQPPTCRKCNREVDETEITYGYEFAKDKFVTVSRDELRAVRPREAAICEIRHFVSQRAVDPAIYFEGFYFLEPGKGGAKAYLLLKSALRAEKVLGQVYVVVRERPRLAFIQARTDGLYLFIARNPATLVEEERPVLDGAVDQKQLEIARELIRLGKSRFSPSQLAVQFADLDRAFQEMINLKIQGSEVVEPSPTVGSGGVDLMRALRDSITQTKQAQKAR